MGDSTVLPAGATNVVAIAAGDWGSILNTNQALPALNVFVCPAYAPRHFTNWVQIYGVRQDPVAELTEGELDEILVTTLTRAALSICRAKKQTLINSNSPRCSVGSWASHSGIRFASFITGTTAQRSVTPQLTFNTPLVTRVGFLGGFGGFLRRPPRNTRNTRKLIRGLLGSAEAIN